MLNNCIATYGKNALNRMGHLRELDFIKSGQNLMFEHRYLLLFEKKVLIKGHKQVFFSVHEILNIKQHCEYEIYLGSNDNVYYFALCINNFERDIYSCADVKELPMCNIMQDEEVGIVAQALSIINWHKGYKFCSACGKVTVLACHGWRRDCTGCNMQHFPRIDPVVIMLVTNEDYCLLGSGNNFSEKRYSCLAGFMEPGETIEAAAARELYEEAGVIGDTARYLTSQPWPFPFSLMIGVHIKTKQKKITIDNNELRDIKWINKADVKAVLNGEVSADFNLPPKVAIAHTLLQYWVEN